MSDNKENVTVLSSNIQVSKETTNDVVPQKKESGESEPSFQDKPFQLADKDILSSEAIDVSKQIETLYREGRRSALLNKHSAALKPLSECCELIAKHRGETHWTMAECGYWYGNALMKVSLANSDIFGSKIPAEKPENDEDDEEDAPALGSINEEPANSDQPGPSSAEPGPSSSNDIDGTSDEISDHELAYEWLELARTIFAKHETEKSQLRLCDCLRDLSELKMEDEKFQESVEDTKTLIEIQKKFLDPNGRDVAASYYELGVMEEMLQMPQDALKSFKEAHTRLADLEASAKKKLADASAEEAGKLMKEHSDLKEILPEVAARIDGCQLAIKEYDEVKSTLKDMMKQTLTGAPITSIPTVTGLSAAQPAQSSVNQLTAKRKIKTDTKSEADQPAKKAKETEQ
ncbi:Oidioi.mRNA.OKI2018_I69.XSR.g16033.t1.cds [Oikopleura dioica]|uniref:Oidioi.mRNA.OKI2018_I69.XSR.g16033.t1.cds n=1 Tax=Oikopleura dioica TaxID=34765 RepID=A0ABN7SEQ3_OIKDI|nr:Oidioi.mRNA.OKI2018_I69.XSR.g16033.t1.cds [Oikopleura dioica]